MKKMQRRNKTDKDGKPLEGKGEKKEKGDGESSSLSSSSFSVSIIIVLTTIFYIMNIIQFKIS